MKAPCRILELFTHLSMDYYINLKIFCHQDSWFKR